MIDKQQLKRAILSRLDQGLIAAIEAAESARLAAIDDQSVAETQYDTLAIEASYLAEGQSRRIEEFKQAITAFSALKLTTLTDDHSVCLGALVQLDNDAEINHWYFIVPAGGGMKLTLDDAQITLITSASPLGKALIGKEIEDEISFSNNNCLGLISAIY